MIRWVDQMDGATVGRWVQPALAVIFAGLTVGFVFIDPDHTITYGVIEGALAIPTAALLFYIGYRYVARSSMSEGEVWRVTWWAFAGMGFLLVLNLWFRVLESITGVVEPRFAATTSLAVGAIGGSVVGLAVVRAKQRHKEREQALADYEELFEQAEEGIFFTDPESGRILDVNQSGAEMYGYRRDELIGMTIKEVTADHPDYDNERVYELIQRAIAGDPQRFEWLGLRADDSTFWVEVTLKQTAIGADERLIAIVRDISNRKHQESQLKEQNARLDEFAGVVSHDLRNPLNVAQGRLALAHSEREGDHLEIAVRNLDRMEEMLSDLLTLARAGQDIDEQEPVDLDEVVQQSWENVETQHATLENYSGLRVIADRSRLRELLENLFRNAIEHSDDPVTISVGECEDGFYVADDGPGIPASKRDQVFESGYTLAAEGTGFGLSIVEAIAQAHGWQIDVSENPGGGARFEITGIQLGS